MSPERDPRHFRAYRADIGTLDDRTRSIGATIATEAPVLMWTWDGEVDEVLLMSGARFARQVPLQDTHETWSVRATLGSTREIAVAGTELRARNFFASDQPSLDAWGKVKDGHLTDNSIGYVPLRWVDVAPGQSLKVDGRTWTAGERTLRVTTEWELTENSVCPIGADRAAKMRAEAARREERRMGRDKREDTEDEEEREDGEEDEGVADSSMEDVLDAAVEGAIEDVLEEKKAKAEAKAEGDEEGDEEMEEKDARASKSALTERARQREIRRLGSGLDPALVQRACDEGWGMIRTTTAFLEAMKGTRGKPAKQRTHRAVAPKQALEDALLMQCGVFRCKSENEYDKRAEAAQKWSRMGPSSLVEMSLRSQGAFRIGMSREEAWTLQNHYERQAGMPRSVRADPITTLTLPHLFSNLVNKAVMVGYDEQEDTTDWCSVGFAPDMKPMQRIRIGAMPTPPEVPLGARPQSADFDEDHESYSLKRYGEMIILDEIYLLNDDLNQLAQIAMLFGSAAKRLRADKVYGVLLDNAALGDSVTLFHATSHGGNLVSGQGSVLSEAALSVAIQTMGKQTGKQGEQLNIMPKYLVVPWELRGAARALTESDMVVMASAEAKIPTKNIHQGVFEVRVEGRLSNTTFNSDATGTRWFAIAPANRTPTVEVGYLRSQPEPRVVELPLDTSVQRKWEVVHFVEAKALDARGMVRCEGV